MRAYALTYPQLMNQALEVGLDREALARLRRTHDFAETMVNGMYRASRVPFLNHLVRTASIALAHRPTLPVVLSSLTHAAYILHRFDGSRRETFRPSHRDDLRAALGADVEARVACYQELDWFSATALATHLRNLDGYDPVTTDVLAVRMMNELEDLLDCALAYTQVPEQVLVGESRQADCLALCRALELPELADELRAAYRDHLAARIPDELVRASDVGYESRTRLWIANPIERTMRRGLRRVRRLVRAEG